MQKKQQMVKEGVYVLKLTNGKYYVGYSTNMESRINAHFRGEGAAWTRAFRPLNVQEMHENKDKAHETQLTLEYMRKHGWQNVRGGPYVQVEMPNPPQEFETEMTCFRCRSNTHLVRNCPERRNSVSSTNSSRSSSPSGSDMSIRSTDNTLFFLIVFCILMFILRSSSSETDDYSDYDEYYSDFSDY